MPRVDEAVLVLATTALLALGLNPCPPYSFGMMRPKKRSRLRKSHTSGGRSRRCHTSQSFVIRHTSSTGPSRNACSSSVRSGKPSASSFRKSGRPENSSPSTQTVPASMASCSVSEIVGRKRSACIAFITPSERARRAGGTRKTRASATKTPAIHHGAPKPTRATRPASAHAHSGAPVKPSTKRTRRTPRRAAHQGVTAARAPWSTSRAFMTLGVAAAAPPAARGPRLWRQVNSVNRADVSVKPYEHGTGRRELPPPGVPGDSALPARVAVGVAHGLADVVPDEVVRHRVAVPAVVRLAQLGLDGLEVAVGVAVVVRDVVAEPVGRGVVGVVEVAVGVAVVAAEELLVVGEDPAVVRPLGHLRRRRGRGGDGGGQRLGPVHLVAGAVGARVCRRP